MTLRELTHDYMRVMDMIADPEIEPQVIADTLEGIAGEIETKADGYATIITEVKATIATLKQEEERLYGRRKMLEAKVDRMKTSLRDSMIAIDTKKIKTDLYSFTVKDNAESVVLADDLDVNSIPMEYQKFAQPTVDKTAVKEALQAGEKLPWAKLERTKSLIIK